MGTTSVLPIEGELTNAPEIDAVITTLLDTSNDFVNDIDDLQDQDPREPTSYVPDKCVIQDVLSLIDITSSNLFNLSLSSASETRIILEADTNLIVLTHRIYGYSEDNLDLLLRNNLIGLNDVYTVPKGREIVFYK